MKFYVIACGPMDVIAQIQQNILWFNLEMCKNKFDQFSFGSKIYTVEVNEQESTRTQIQRQKNLQENK